MAPKRIQRRRTRGWRKPPGLIYVGRGKHRYSGFANPHKVGMPDIPTSQAAVNAYRDGVSWGAFPVDDIEKLRGYDLACWCRLCPKHADGKPLTEYCPDCEPCHVDALAELLYGAPTTLPEG